MPWTVWQKPKQKKKASLAPLLSLEQFQQALAVKGIDCSLKDLSHLAQHAKKLRAVKVSGQWVIPSEAISQIIKAWQRQKRILWLYDDYFSIIYSGVEANPRHRIYVEFVSYFWNRELFFWNC